MSADHGSEAAESIDRIVSAFGQMPVPPGPSIEQTLGVLDRSANPRGLRPAKRTWRRRVAVGGVGLSLLLGLALLVGLLNSGTEVSAMDRMAKKLQSVRSFSYQLETRNTFVKSGATVPTSVIRTGTATWLAPASLFAEEKIWHLDGAQDPDAGKAELVVHITEVYPAGKPGILIDHVSKTYRRLPELRPQDIPPYSPVAQLRMVQQRRGKILRELGTKEIDGKAAQGFVMAFPEGTPKTGPESLEVWVDRETDLPLEFGYTIQNDAGPEFFRVTNCRWNITVAPETFSTSRPKGYSDLRRRTPGNAPRENGLRLRRMYLN